MLTGDIEGMYRSLSSLVWRKRLVRDVRSASNRSLTSSLPLLLYSLYYLYSLLDVVSDSPIVDFKLCLPFHGNLEVKVQRKCLNCSEIVLFVSYDPAHVTATSATRLHGRSRSQGDYRKDVGIAERGFRFTDCGFDILSTLPW